VSFKFFKDQLPIEGSQTVRYWIVNDRMRNRPEEIGTESVEI